MPDSPTAQCLASLSQFGSPGLWRHRVGSLAKVPGVLRRHGMDPAPLIAQSGLSPDALGDPENRVPWPAVAGLMEDCVIQSGCEHFALLLGREWDLSDLGFLGELGRQCPTVGQAV